MQAAKGAKAAPMNVLDLIWFFSSSRLMFNIIIYHYD